MPLYKIDFSVSTNEDWVDTLAFVNGDPAEAVDLTGSSFLMHVREELKQLSTVLILSTSNGRLLIESDPADEGKLTVMVAQEVVELITPATYVYDLVWTMADGRDVNLAAGTVTVNLGITR